MNHRTPLTPPKTGDQLLDQYYLDLRMHLLEVAAGLDRIQRAGGTVDPRLQRLRDAGHIALDEQPERATRLLEFLSVPSQNCGLRTKILNPRCVDRS